MQAKRDYPLFKSIQLINHDYSKTQLLNINLNQLSNKNRISKLLEKINSTSKIRDKSLSQRDSLSDISSEASSHNPSPTLHSSALPIKKDIISAKYQYHKRNISEFTLDEATIKNKNMINDNLLKFIRQNRKSTSNTAKIPSPSRIIEKMNGVINEGYPEHQIDISENTNSINSLLFVPQEKVFPTNPLSNHYFIKPLLSQNLLELSYKENQNVAYKSSMEDKGTFTMYMNSNNNNHLITLFDGHGGSSISSYLQQNFATTFKSKLLQHTSIPKALFNTFISIDKQIHQLDLVNMGSTGTAVYITQENNVNVLYCANIGDTRCMLISPTHIERISCDHRADEPKEKQRIENSGGFVVNGRVNGRLMLSRAFGDFEMKNFGVKAEPHISRKEIHGDIEGNNLFMVLACDGIWDVLSETDVQQIIKYEINKNSNQNNITERMSNTILNSAIVNGAWDNLSLFVVKLT